MLTQHPPQFPERKERNESGEYDDISADQSVDADFAQNAFERSTMDSPFDDFFNKGKGERKQQKMNAL